MHVSILQFFLYFFPRILFWFSFRLNTKTLSTKSTGLDVFYYTALTPKPFNLDICVCIDFKMSMVNFYDISLRAMWSIIMHGVSGNFWNCLPVPFKLGRRLIQYYYSFVYSFTKFGNQYRVGPNISLFHDWFLMLFAVVCKIFPNQWNLVFAEYSLCTAYKVSFLAFSGCIRAKMRLWSDDSNAYEHEK